MRVRGNENRIACFTGCSGTHRCWCSIWPGWKPAADAYQFRAEEIKQTAFRLDGVLVPSFAQPNTPVVFVEVQT